MLGLGIGIGIVRVETIHIRQKDQQICLEQGSYLSRQGIIITHLDFLDGDGIIFIDDGNGPLAQQNLKGLRGILVAPGIRKIILGQEDLGGHDAVLHEILGIFFNQEPLANCSAGLFFRNLGRPFFKA